MMKPETLPLPKAARFDSVTSRAGDLRKALLLIYITLGWMTIEGAASLLLACVSKSLLLEAFGIDSVIELFSGSVLLWRLRVEASGFASAERAEEVERRAAGTSDTRCTHWSCMSCSIPVTAFSLPNASPIRTKASGES
jgi:hypothetical protein